MPLDTQTSEQRLELVGGLVWPAPTLFGSTTDQAPEETPRMHIGEFLRGKGKFFVTEFVPTSERTTRRYPLLRTTSRMLTHYNVRARAWRTDDMVWPRPTSSRSTRTTPRSVPSSRAIWSA
jgi:formate dehydrogenase major subunit